MSTSVLPTFSWSTWLTLPQVKVFLGANIAFVVLLMLVAWSHRAPAKTSNVPLVQHLDKTKRKLSEYYNRSIQATKPLVALQYAEKAQALWHILKAAPEPLEASWANVGQVLDQHIAQLTARVQYYIPA